MRLAELLSGIEILSGDFDLSFEIEKVEFNSKNIGRDDLFVCFKGWKEDGREYVREALERGAYAVVTDLELDFDCKIIRVADARKTLSRLAINFFGNPVSSMRFVAVTGTNGKTTTAYLINEILKKRGVKTGFIGTIYYEIDGKRYQSNMTTPDPFEFNGLLYEMRKRGVEIVVSEVSAHAVFLDKLDGIKSDIAVFTNLSQDHLDFFGDMESYKSVKKSYFNSQNTKFAIINADDACGREIMAECDVPFVSYGTETPADVFALDVKRAPDGARFLLNLYDSIVKISSPLRGGFNVYNLLAAAAACGALGLSAEEIRESIENIQPPEGRFNVLKSRGVTYIVDFAHTPDGLENLLSEARRLSKSKLCVVFGCGGERDRKKRPIMGAIAEKYADRIVLTEDNSRWEITADIINEIKSGIIERDSVCVIEERKKAIEFAAQLAKIGDVVVIAGKGAENYIEREGEKTPFNDMECLKAAIGS